MVGTLFSIFVVVWIILCIFATIRSNKLKKIAYKNLEASQTNENVDEFIKIVSRGSITNQPPVWNRVRGIWFMVNESPNVTTDRKTELRNLLVSKGLRLTPNERKIIDND